MFFKTNFRQHTLCYSFSIFIIHKLCSNSEPDKYNKSYLSTAIKWAIRNELRHRYKWYTLKHKADEGDTTDTNDYTTDTSLGDDAEDMGFSISPSKYHL